jgi:hypothetical protein
MSLLVALLVIAAIFVPAPLGGPADITRVPNPVKAAWFLLWIQELVSYSKYLVYPIICLGLCFLFLPYLPGSPECRRASWMQKDQLAVSLLTVVFFSAILVLTVIAMFFRGENWALVFAF